MNAQKRLARLLIIYTTAEDASRQHGTSNLVRLAQLTSSLLEDEYLALRDPELGALPVELRARVEKVIREGR